MHLLMWIAFHSPRQPCHPGVGAIIVAALFIGVLPVDAAYAQQSKIDPVIRGQVTDETTGRGIPHVYIELLDSRSRVRGSAATDTMGMFVLEGAITGTFRLRATRIGYATTVTPRWWTESGEMLTVTVRLHPDAVLLAPLEITARSRSESPMLANFYHRVDRAAGGTFITREEIERRGPNQVTDLLLEVPGVQLLSSGRGNQRMVTMSRALGCPAQIYVDGRHMNLRGEVISIDEIVMPNSVEGIEIYRGLGTVPAEFLSPRAKCGVIAIWTRRGG